MKKSDLRTADYIEHMLEAIAYIQEYVAPLSPETFASTRMAIDAVVRNLEIIGEAARNVMLSDPVFAASHTEIPWESMYAMRNRISHGYFAVNAHTIWVTVQRDLPELERNLRSLKCS
ncbi:DUF86 domain-containing protein [Paraburkholderia sacchari]|uniref:HepT-like ribonuclease domain-containing protein n=1 Tax=Paraburkholderia sacchari TaxID=159450 RepID=UPI0039A444C3